MAFILDEYIDDYIRKSKTTRNKKIAQHLKKIIPKTNHLNESIFNKIIKEIKAEIENDLLSMPDGVIHFTLLTKRINMAELEAWTLLCRICRKLSMRI